MTTEYLHWVNESMKMLAADSRVIFVGQAVSYPGHAITHQVKDLDGARRLEFPVAEEMQAGFCLGLTMEGNIPVCIYPRWNFALLAANQIVNHIDKWEELTGKPPHMIIKVAVGSDEPLDPGPQHKANYTEAFRSMCQSIKITELLDADDVWGTYNEAINYPGVHMIIEHSKMYATGPLWER